MFERDGFENNFVIDLDSRSRFHKTCDSVPVRLHSANKNCPTVKAMRGYPISPQPMPYGPGKFQKDHGIDSGRYMNIDRYIYMYSICIYVDIYKS